MEALQKADWGALRDTLLSLTVAALCGLLIGSERQFRQRTAGLRTNMLVAVAAALFVDMAERLEQNAGAVHVSAYVVSGVGFLGAGAIMREGGSVRGLNTAATLWGSAAVGACAGADLLLEALLGTCFVMGINVVLRPVARALVRRPAPAQPGASVSVIFAAEHEDSARTELLDALESVGLFVQELTRRNLGDRDGELTAHLGAAVDSAALAEVAAKLRENGTVDRVYVSCTSSRVTPL